MAREEVGLPVEPPQGWDSLPGVIYTLAGGMALVVPLLILLHQGAHQGQWKTGGQKIK